MIPKKRIRLSAMQRVQVWRRWKAESRYMRWSSAGQNNVVIYLLLKRHGGIAPPSAAVHRVHSPWQNEKTSPAESLVARRFAESPKACTAVPRRSAGKPAHGGRAQYRANESISGLGMALRPEPCLLATHTPLREIVASKLMQTGRPSKFPDG